ncbi:unnamed protein product [Effrenium voratum]|nr:unnamed protein product [Effrenium voratum]
MLVHDCLRRNEDGHFVLVHKTPKNPIILQQEWLDIQPKFGRKKVKRPAEEEQKLGSSTAVGNNSSLAEQMVMLPGLFQFMTQRDRDARRHLPPLKLRSLCVYLMLLVLTAWCLFRLRPPLYSYWCNEGIAQVMTGEIHSAPFESIRSVEGIWTWLEETVAAELFVEDSVLRRHNYLLGYVQVLTQQVTETESSTCVQASAVQGTGNFTCVGLSFDESNADKTRQQEIEAYWSGKVGQDGRSFSEPWVFSTGRTAGAHPQTDAFREFDASGYSADYHLQYTPLSKVHDAFLNDMKFLQQVDWLSPHTRALHVSFVVFNANHQTWVWNRFTFEMTAFGVIYPLSHIEDFRPRLNEYGMEYGLLGADLARLVLVILVCFQVFLDVWRLQTATGAGWKHFLTLQAITDLLIFVLFLVAFIRRMAFYTSESSVSHAMAAFNELSFHDVGQISASYNFNAILDGVVVALCCFRFAYFMRVSRAVFVVWSAVERAASVASSLVPLVLLSLLGFVVVGMAVDSRDSPYTRTIGLITTRVVMLLAGDDRTVAALHPDRPAELLYSVVLSASFRLFILNTWIAVMMQEYHRVRIAAGFDPKQYRWKEYDWVRWGVAWPFSSLYLRFRPKAEPSKRFTDEDSVASW